ncbi:MAG: hypothetical protein ABSE53_12830 [Terracidiphilus sp.]|jgi:hypothetical protein
MSEQGFPSPSIPPAFPPTNVPRGAMTFGQILDRVLQLMRANLRLFMGIALVPAGLIVAYCAVILAAFFPLLKPLILNQQPHFPLMTMVWLFAAEILGWILMIVIYALYEPAAVYAALEANAGTRVTIGKAWAVAWRKAGRYIWLAILRALIVMLPILVFGGVIVGTVGLSMARGRGAVDPSAMIAIIPLFVLLYVGAMVYAVLVMLRLVLAVPASVAEDLSAWKGIRRSNQLTNGAKGRTFLLALLIYAIAYAAFLVAEVGLFFLGAIVALIGMMLHLAMAPWGYIGIGVAAVVFICAYLLWMAAIAGAYCTLFAVLYRDQRLRLEGVAGAQA